jgi:hypothetical protein
MANILVETVPSSKKDEKIDEKIKKIVEDRNKVISKRFNLEERDIKVILHMSRSKLLTSIMHQGDSLGIYCGFVPGKEEFNLIHPNTVDAIFGENLDKEFLIFIDYCLIKYYMNIKYYPKIEDFKIFHKYLTESVAKITSGNFRKEILLFDMKSYIPNSRLNKEKELMLAFYIILEKSGLDYIYEILDELEQKGDIKKFIFDKYNKSLGEIIEEYKKAILEEERKAEIKFRNERKANWEKNQNSSGFNKNRTSSFNSNNNSENKRKITFRRGYLAPKNFKENNSSNNENKKTSHRNDKIKTDDKTNFAQNSEKTKKSFVPKINTNFKNSK